MQFSKSWLQEFFDSSLDAIDLAQTLTIAGIEVEDIQDLSGLSDQIVVGEIVAMEKHPDADRLNVCQVDVGANDLLQIVCGAPNARIGIKIPCAMVGAKLPGVDIKKAKLNTTKREKPILPIIYHNSLFLQLSSEIEKRRHVINVQSDAMNDTDILFNTMDSYI